MLTFPCLVRHSSSIGEGLQAGTIEEQHICERQTANIRARAGMAVGGGAPTSSDKSHCSSARTRWARTSPSAPAPALQRTAIDRTPTNISVSIAKFI